MAGATTPVRKISAHEFEKGGLLKPIVTTIDGTPTFLSPAVNSSNVALVAKVRRSGTGRDSNPQVEGMWLGKGLVNEPLCTVTVYSTYFCTAKV